MGLNRVSNPAKLRKLERLIGQPVLRAYARFFRDQTTLIVFTSEHDAWTVNRHGTVTRYLDEPVTLVENGIALPS